MYLATAESSLIVTKWVNTEPDEGALPALLQRVEAQLPIDTLDSLWIFPTRRAGSVESTVVVASCVSTDPDRRTVFTAHFTTLRDKKGRPTVQERFQEHAAAPAEAIARVVDGVVRRLGEDAIRPPRMESVAGDPARFDALIVELGGTPLSRTQAEESESPQDAPATDAADDAVEASASSPAEPASAGPQQLPG